MKPSILVVMLDFLVCSLLMFVVGDTSGPQPSPAHASSSAAVGSLHDDFGPAAVEAMRAEWNQDYEQQILLAQLNTQRTENEQLRGSLVATSDQLSQTSATLSAKQAEAQALQELTAQREQAIQKLDTNLKELAAQKEQETQALQALNAAREQQIQQLDAQKQKAQQELASTQADLSHLATEREKLRQEQATLQQRTQQLAQTINSQQDTIRTLTENVSAGQSRLEGQFARFAEDQQRMGNTLSQLETWSRSLPDVIRENTVGISKDQETLMANIAALTDRVAGLQAGLSEADRQALMQAVNNVASGQKQLQAQLDTVIQNGQNDQIAGKLGSIQTGQDALRNQTASLASQIEELQARKEGPFKAVKNSRVELRVAISKKRYEGDTPYRFRSTLFPPLVQVDNQTYVIANTEDIGLNWWVLSAANQRGEITELQFSVAATDGAQSPAALLQAEACVLAADTRVAALPAAAALKNTVGLELAGAEAVLQAGQRTLHVFKTTSAGLSFEVETSPSLEDNRYLQVKRNLRGIAAWYENPAYRPAAGDYLVTTDGKLVGIMVDHEKCFILTKDRIASCAQSIPLADPAGFQQGTSRLQVRR
jgi:chromosome segregation ATPase